MNETQMQKGTPMQEGLASTESSRRSELIRRNEEGATVSVFRGAPATDKEIVTEVGRLSKVFTNSSEGFYETLVERIRANKMTPERLRNAVDTTLDNCRYPTFAIADIVGYDIRFKVYSYNEMGMEMTRMGTTQKDFAPLRFRGEERPLWVTRSDKVKFHIPDEI